MLQAPLEQFQILAILPIRLLFLDLSITNFLIINLLVIFFYNNFMYYSSSHNCLKENYFYLTPSAWQKSLESVAEITSQLICDLISSNNDKHFPLIFILFNFILFSNLIGLIPYTFTTTSHIIITSTLSFSIFIGVNIITFEKYGLKIFSLFLPANTNFFLALVLVPLEFLSYITKPISLGVRLFVNLMAGHSLLKVIVSFAWSMLLLENFISLGLIIPTIILVVLFGLELGVALIQTYVFIVLTCIIIQDGS